MKSVLSVVGGFVVAAVGSPLPPYLIQALSISGLFILLDTVAGLWLAFVSGKAQSRKAREMLVSKVIQYLILLCLCVAASLLTKRWDWTLLGSMGIVGIEGLSLIETAIQLQDYGVNLGPIAPLIEKLKRYFAVMARGDSDDKGGRGSA
ncbi:MAG: phage holin family protein [Armatimonadetes bacterium]|nr:phage holin family protein [Armatimonadota bacterium]